MADAKQGAREKRLREGGGSGIGSGDDEAETGGKLSAAASAMAEGPTAADGVVMHDPNKFVAAACVLRLVVLPAICLPLHLLLRQIGALSADPIVLMILTISAGTPSSQTLVMYQRAVHAARHRIRQDLRPYVRALGTDRFGPDRHRVPHRRGRGRHAMKIGARRAFGM